MIETGNCKNIALKVTRLDGILNTNPFSIRNKHFAVYSTSNNNYDLMFPMNDTLFNDQQSGSILIDTDFSF